MDKYYNINFNEIKDIKTLKETQEKINCEINERLSEMRTNEFGKQLSESSFGYIKNCFEEFTPYLFENKEGKKIIKKYIKTIRENKNLGILHGVYESVRRTGKDTDVNYFINTLVSTEKDINKKTIKEDVKKLGDVLNEAYHIVNKNLPEKEESLDNILPENKESLNAAIEYVVENKSTTKNLPEFSFAIKTIREDIESREHSLVLSKSKDVNTNFDNLVESYNERYNDLSDTERKIVNEILSSSDSESVFNKYLKECLNKINDKVNYFISVNDNESVKRLNGIYEQIAKKKYSSETLSEDINNIVEITELFG